MHRKVHMQGHAMQCIGKCICRGMQCNAYESAYAGACNAMQGKMHMQGHAMQCIAKYLCRSNAMQCIAKVYKL